MKITKKYLQQIIKEEVKYLEENKYDFSMSPLKKEILEEIDRLEAIYKALQVVKKQPYAKDALVGAINLNSETIFELRKFFKDIQQYL